MTWYNDTLIKSNSAEHMEGIPAINRGRIFMFKGEDGYTDETSTEEINGFLMDNLPPPGTTTNMKNFDYAEYMINSGTS